MFTTQEAITAEIDYRHERAEAAALRRNALVAHRGERWSWLRGPRSRARRTPARRVTPALP
jgi:hypothetical protein